MKWFLFTIFVSSGGTGPTMRGQHPMPDLPTCEAAAKTAHGSMSHGAESEGGWLVYCGTKNEEYK